MKKKNTKTTIWGIVAAAAMLMSHEDSPLKPLIPKEVQTVGILLGALGIGAVGVTAADKEGDPPPPPPPVK